MDREETKSRIRSLYAQFPKGHRIMDQDLVTKYKVADSIKDLEDAMRDMPEMGPRALNQCD
jgi:hypothetical protein